MIQLITPERVDTAYAPPGPFADELRRSIKRLYKLGQKTHRTRPGQKGIFCNSCYTRYPLKGTEMCETCWNDTILLEKLTTGEIKSIEDLMEVEK